MVKKNKFTIVLIIISMICSGCSNNKNDERIVTIAYNPTAYASAVSQIMISNNILDKYLPKDVKINYVEMSSAADIRDALASGTIDIATPALTAFIAAYENNMPIQLISNYGSAQVCMYGNNDINSITDFEEGDLIAIKGLNTNPHIALLAYCKEMGLDIDKYNKMLNKIPEPETIAMLSNSSIKGAVLSYPITKQAENLDNCKMLIDFSDVIKKYSLGTVACANTQFFESNQDIVNAFEKAHKEIVDNWDENMDENAKILSLQYKCKKEEVCQLIREFPPQMQITGYDELASLMYECGMLQKEPKKYNFISN